MNEAEYTLVAIKRPWMPEWAYSLIVRSFWRPFCVRQPLRWVLHVGKRQAVMEGREIRPGFLNQKLDSLVSAMTDELRDAVDTSPETAQAGFRARGEPSGGPEPVNEPPRPDDRAETDIMSNMDFSVESGGDQTVRESGEVYAHAAWNFYGYVWFADGRFHEQVWRYHAPVAQFWADSLEDLMHLVNDAYGWD